MNCFHPTVLTDQKDRGKTVSVPCGKCLACLGKLRKEWSFRIQQELKGAASAHFITLTYSDEHNTGSLCKRDIQLFLKRLRKHFNIVLSDDLPSYYTPISTGQSLAFKSPQIRYYCVGEYGTKTFRPHYHLILFNLCTKNLELLITKTWDKGIVHVGTVTPSSIAYVTKYVITRDEYHWEQEQKPFALMSRRPGIGANYLATMRDYHKEGFKNHVTLPGGEKQKLPRYYKDKIFNKHEKAYLSAQSRRIALDAEKEKTDKILEQTPNFVLYEETQREQAIKNFLKSSKINKL